MKKIYIKEEIVNNYLFNNLIYAGIFLNDESKNLLKIYIINDRINTS